MPRVNDYIIRKNGKYYFSGETYGDINNARIFGRSIVRDGGLVLDKDDELLEVKMDGSLVEREYTQRNPN